ncbi:MAG: hypothetical protein ISS79_10875 [Phycisphaerae bacterium]|nr:hypothetical protein [Phycisphaerae bacterium]
MQGQNFIRTLLFVVFFGIGAAAMCASVLCDDFVRHYRNKHFLRQAERLTEKLESLNDDYDALLMQLEDDPNLIKRLAPAAIGADHTDPGTIYPRATARELAEAKKVLAEVAEAEPNEPPMPRWLMRCEEPRRRIYLFLCGAALILVSFVCFRPLKTIEAEE